MEIGKCRIKKILSVTLSLALAANLFCGDYGSFKANAKEELNTEDSVSQTDYSKHVEKPESPATPQHIDAKNVENGDL